MPYTLDTLTLPDLVWTDEYNWSPVGQSAEETLTGALILETTGKQAGRPITLSKAWATKAEVDILRALVVANGEHELTLPDGRSFDVRFDHSGPALTAAPVLQYSDPQTTDNYEITLKFLEI